MRKIHSRGKLENSAVMWLLEGNEIEFGEQEFLDIIAAITEGERLFAVLQRERPALKDHLLEIYQRDLMDLIEEHDLEFVLEQTLFDLKDRVRL